MSIPTTFSIASSASSASESEPAGMGTWSEVTIGGKTADAFEPSHGDPQTCLYRRHSLSHLQQVLHRKVSPREWERGVKSPSAEKPPMRSNRRMATRRHVYTDDILYRIFSKFCIGK